MPVEKEPSTEGRLSQQVQRLTWLVGASLALGLVTLIVLVVKDFGSSGDDAEAVEREREPASEAPIASQIEEALGRLSEVESPTATQVEEALRRIDTALEVPETFEASVASQVDVLEAIDEFLDLRAVYNERFYGRGEESIEPKLAEQQLAKAISAMLASRPVEGTSGAQMELDLLEVTDGFFDMRASYGGRYNYLDSEEAKELMAAERQVAKAVSAALGSSSYDEWNQARLALLKVSDTFFDARAVHLSRIYSNMGSELATRELILAERRVAKGISAMLARME